MTKSELVISSFFAVGVAIPYFRNIPRIDEPVKFFVNYSYQDMYLINAAGTQFGTAR